VRVSVPLSDHLGLVHDEDVSVDAHTPPDPAIACTALTKDYGDGRGVFDLALAVESGEVMGFVGPNGAGKSTTIKLLMDLIRPDRGSATIFGLDTRRDSREIKRRVGYLPGELPQYPGVKAGYVVGLLAGLRGGVPTDRIERLADRLGLDLGARYEKLSHGNKQKVHLVQAFMHEPDLLILDEPTLGLDPLVQQEFRLLVQEAADRGATVLLSSHVLSEVENVCDRISLIRAGRLLRTGTLEELRSTRVHRIEAIIEGSGDSDELACVPYVSEARIEGSLVTCSVRGSIAPLLAWLTAHDVVELDSRELSLEEVFVSEFADHDGRPPVPEQAPAAH
jgi:ABC-2 type transport system ATP-binding protein